MAIRVVLCHIRCMEEITSTALYLMTDQKLPIPSVQIKEIEQRIHSEKVISLLLANAKARRGF